MSVDSPKSDHRTFDPSWAIRDDVDATIVLLLWCIRKSFFPMLWLGMTIATITLLIESRDPAELTDTINSLQTPGDYIGAVLSPFAVVVAAFVIRFGVGFLAFAAAYPLSAAAALYDYDGVGRVGRFTRTWFDRLYLTRGYRALRWTWRVRTEAAGRLGRRGEILSASAVALRWASIVLFVVFLVATMISAGVAAS